MALALHHSLLRHPEGRAFLFNEPRASGALHDFAALLQHTLQHLGTVSAAAPSPRNNTSGNGTGAAPTAVVTRPASPTTGRGPSGSIASPFGQRLLSSPGSLLLFGSPAAPSSPAAATLQAHASVTSSSGGGGAPSCCLDARCVRL